MHYLLSKYLKEINSKIICKIIPVGGHKQVIELMEKYPTLSYPKSKIQSMLDADVKDTYKEVSKKVTKQMLMQHILICLEETKIILAF